MTDRDARGRYVKPDEPGGASANWDTDPDLAGYIEGRLDGWHLARADRIPPLLWITLGAVTGWALTAIAFVAAGR